MECEIMEMDTGSDSPSHSPQCDDGDDDGPSQIPETPSPPGSSLKNFHSSSSSKSSPIRCNFNVVIDIEDDPEAVADDTRQKSLEHVASSDLMVTEMSPSCTPEFICAVDKGSGSDTDFEEPAEEIPFSFNKEVAKPDVVNESQSQPSSDELYDTKDCNEEEHLVNENASLASSTKISLLEQKKQERKLLEQKMRDLEPLRNAQFVSLKKLNPDEKIFPSVRPSNFHTIAFLITNDYKPGDVIKPFPVSFVNKWHPEFVPMPCSRQNTKVVKIRVASPNVEQDSENSKTYEERVYIVWELIDDALSRPLLTCRDIQLSIKQYCGSTREFTALNYAIERIMTNSERENFFTKVLPVMQTLCLDLKSIVTSPLPLLSRFMNHSISLTQKQIASLLANAFFSTFPKRLEDELMFPTINFNELFIEDPADHDRLVVKANKIRCILHYFERIVEDMPKGVVTYMRKSIRNSKTPDWKNSTKKLTKLVALMDGTIETDGAGFLGVDFANKIIGGGVLGRGAVQEEILFVIYPELLLTRLFTEKLTACEAVIVTGCERFCHYSGYANNFEYAASFYDCTPWDPMGRKCTQFVAIDALYITKQMSQFHPRLLKRELDKAYVGFSSPNGSTVAVATGKWGCGAFNGDPQLKTVLQLLAASMAGRDIALFTFGDLYLLRDIENMYSILKDMTIGEVWNLLEKYYNLFCTSKKPGTHSLAEFLEDYAAGGLLANLSEGFGSSQDSLEANEPSASASKTFKEIPIRQFYFSNKTSLQSKEKEHKKPNISDTAKPSDANVSTSNSNNGESWLDAKLDAMESVKASFAANLKDNSEKVTKVEENIGSPTALLNEDQITSIIMEESMDVGESEEAKAVKRCKSSNVSTNTSPNSGRKSLSTSRMGKSASSPSSIAAACSSCPKPKKQMTLKDFFG